MTTVAIIPARGGSKRLPRKNILPILGKPMLSYPVNAALQCGLFDQVIVSTEDDEIRGIAIQSGAQVMNRPGMLAGDDAGVVQVCRDVLEKLHHGGINPTRFCCIYATALFITPEDLRRSFQLMEKYPDTEVVMGVSGYNLNPLQALGPKGDGCLTPQRPDDCKLQSQFHPKLVASNGTLYWAKVQAFLKSQTFYPESLRGYEIPWIKAIDLNTPEDYQYLRLLAPLFLNRGSA